MSNDSVATCSATATDPDGTTPTLSYAWLNETTSAHLGSKAQVTLTLLHAQPGDTLRCTATASDGALTDTKSTTVVVGNRAPSVTTPGLTRSPVFNNSVAMCSATATDPDWTTPTLSYAWLNETTSASLGNTAQVTLTSLLAQPGHTLRCTTTASDGALTDTKSMTVVVGNRAPSVTTPKVIPSSGLVNTSTLFCSTQATDPDGAKPTPSYAWLNETTSVSLGNTNQLTLTSLLAQPGHTLRCTTTASDGTLTDTKSTTVVVGNRAPSVTTPTVTPSPVFNDGVATCSATATDPDGMPLTLGFAWTATTGAGTARALGEGVVTGGQSVLRLAADMVSAGDVLNCTATASDGALTVTNSTTVVVRNRFPSITTPTITPSSGVASTSTLTCSTTASDPDGTTPTLGFRWAARTMPADWSRSLGEGVVTDGQSVLILTVATVSRGDVVSCTASASDGEFTAQARADVTVTSVSGGTVQPGDVLVDPRLGALRYVPSGSFTMGCEAGRDDEAGGCSIDESPAHTVTLTKALWMMESELTQEMWTTGLGFTNPSHFSTSEMNRPVEFVNWWEALEAANEASRRDGLAVCYTLTGCNINAVGANRSCSGVTVTSASGHPKDCAGWRLPTEAEWEYAARAGTSFPYAGGSDVDRVAWYASNSYSETQPVCTTPTPRNAWGLCDLSGNVREWTWDGWGVYTGAATSDPAAPASGSHRVSRGGGWYNDALYMRVATRVREIPDRIHGVGFRLVRSVP